MAAAVFGTLLPLPTLAPPASQQPYPSYDYGADPPRLPKRQSSEFFPITGVHTGSGVNGSLPLRIEVRELEKDPVAWTLYILGLDMLQYTPQSELLSWYQIAGEGYTAGDELELTWCRDTWQAICSIR